jgi:hypothetical protein
MNNTIQTIPDTIPNYPGHVLAYLDPTDEPGIGSVIGAVVIGPPVLIGASLAWCGHAFIEFIRRL